MSLMRTGSFDPFRELIRRSQATARRFSSVIANNSPRSLRAFSEKTNSMGKRSYHRGAMNDVFDSMERDFMMVPGWGSAFRFPGAHNMLAGIDAAHGSGIGDRRFGMNLDFHETESGFELTADLPGVQKEDITVDVDRESGVLTVSGERKSNREENKSEGGGEEGGGAERKYHFVERSYGKTTRSIRLPETADVSKANAEYNSGVLTLTFPKREVPAATRRIKIPIEDGGGKAIGDNKASTTEGGGAKMTTDGDDV